MFKHIFQKIRLFTQKRKESYFLYYNILGFYPKHIELYDQACLHRSSSVKDKQGAWINNERLEFLGDAILDAIVADILYQKFPKKKEGFLTNTRSKIVQRESLNQLAIKIGLDKLIVSATKTQTHNNYMYGNALEAFVGAIYLDRGYAFCYRFIDERVIEPYIDLSTIAQKESNFKSKLLEWCQKRKLILEFSLIESYTDSHSNDIFQSQVEIANIVAGIGTGYTKKESQQNAAKMAFEKIKKDGGFMQKITDTIVAAEKKTLEMSQCTANDVTDTEEYAK